MSRELTDDEAIALNTFFNEVRGLVSPEEAINIIIRYFEDHPNEIGLLLKKGMYYTFKRATTLGLGCPKLTREGEIELYQLFNDGHLPEGADAIMPTHIPYDVGAVFLRSLKLSRITARLLWNNINKEVQND